MKNYKRSLRHREQKCGRTWWGGVGRDELGDWDWRVCTVRVCVLSHFRRVWLCNPMDCSPPGSSVCGILQARTLEWVAMPFFKGSSQPRDWTLVSCVSCVSRQILYHGTSREAYLHQIARCFALLSFVRIYHSFFTDLSEEGWFPVGEWIINEVL